MSITIAAAVAAVQLLASAEPAAAGTAGCISEQRPARVARLEYPQTPSIARELHLGGLAVVGIELTTAGTLSNARLVGSTGVRSLDAEALRTARAMRYSPEIRSCTPVAGAYLVEVEFSE